MVFRFGITEIREDKMMTATLVIGVGDHLLQLGLVTIPLGRQSLKINLQLVKRFHGMHQGSCVGAGALAVLPHDEPRPLEQVQRRAHRHPVFDRGQALGNCVDGHFDRLIATHPSQQRVQRRNVFPGRVGTIDKEFLGPHIGVVE